MNAISDNEILKSLAFVLKNWNRLLICFDAVIMMNMETMTWKLNFESWHKDL